MSRNTWLNIAAKRRGIPSNATFDILTSRVYVRVRTWAGTTEGAEVRAGAVTTSDAEILPRPRVRHTSPGMIQIGPIQPYCKAGGVLLSDLLSVDDTAGVERPLLLIVDPLGNSQMYVLNDIDASMALHYTINASATSDRFVPNAP